MGPAAFTMAPIPAWTAAFTSGVVARDAFTIVAAFVLLAADAGVAAFLLDVAPPLDAGEDFALSAPTLRDCPAAAIMDGGIVGWLCTDCGLRRLGSFWPAGRADGCDRVSHVWRNGQEAA